MIKLILILLTILVAFFVGIVIYVDILVYAPINVINFKYKEFPVITKTVARGKAVRYQVDAEQLTSDIPVNVNWKIVCGDIQISRPNTGYVTEKGRINYTNQTIIIPQEAPLGKCYIDTVSRYQISVIRSVVVEHRTDDFIVTK